MLITLTLHKCAQDIQILQLNFLKNKLKKKKQLVPVHVRKSKNMPYPYPLELLYTILYPTSIYGVPLLYRECRRRRAQAKGPSPQGPQEPHTLTAETAINNCNTIQ